jgi:hypothetical protein
MLSGRSLPPDFPFAQYQEYHFRAFSYMDQNKFPEAENLPPNFLWRLYNNIRKGRKIKSTIWFVYQQIDS